MAEGNAITVKIGAETDGIEQGLRKIQGSLKNLESNTKNSAAGVGQSFASMAGAVAVGQAAFEGFKAAASLGLSAVTNSISGLVGSFGSAISAAAQMETLETAFIPLLGSADAAQKRIADLSKFAAETPFELPEVAKASRTLETLTQGALATSEGLRLVGDVASGTNTPFEEMSTTIGRLYDGLQSGRPVGDVMQRLQELGAISGDTRSEIEALSASGQNVEAWAIAEEALGRFSGSMKLQSSTWGGLLSTFSDNVTQALAKFGEPILDNLKPYLSASIKLVEMLAERAADFGKEFSEKFIASSAAAKSFQTAIEAINIGETSKGFQLFWETTKLQAMQTGNEIYKYLSSAFSTVTSTIAKIFGPSSGTFTLVVDSFALIGKAAAQKLAEGILGILPDINNGLLKTLEIMAIAMPGVLGPISLAAKAADAALEGLRGSMSGMKQDVEAQKEALSSSFDSFAINAKKSFSEIPQDFKTNLEAVPPLFEGITEQQNKVAVLEAEIAANVAAGNAEREETNSNLELTGSTAEKLLAVENALTKAIANGNTELATKLERTKNILETKAEEERKAAELLENNRELVALETQINQAKAAGNEELVKSLEAIKQDLESKKEIAKLTEEYQKTLKLEADEAARLANNFVAAKNAAAGIGNRDAVITITTKVDDTRWKDLLAELAVNADPKAIAVALEVTGKDNLTDALSTLQNMETINKNFQSTFETLGARSLEEVKANLEGIPTEAQRQLALEITGQDDLKTAIRNLDTFAGTKTARALLETQGFENVQQLKDALLGITGEKRTQMIVESLGVKDAQAAKDALDAILNNNGKKATITAEADTTPAQEKIAELSTKTTTVPLDGDTNPLQETLSAFSSSAVKLTLDAADSIAAIRTALAEPIKMDLQGSGDGGGTSGLQPLVESIKTLLEKIEPKLPVAALTA
jgi:hypothetical protein